MSFTHFDDGYKSLSEHISRHNEHPTVYNIDRFGPINSETNVITIQVHNRLSYLLHLIGSLRAAKYISTTLLIISHDVYNETINEALRKAIDFCMFTQIFYPHSIQTHPLSFPGDDPNDCPRDITKKEALELDCNNKHHPDMYGHYRESKFTQMKHHWWWKLNFIFDKLSFTRDLNGFLLLLEEDHFVAEDFIHVMSLMKHQMIKTCDKCNVITLGTYDETINRKSFDSVDTFPWTTSRHNMGFAFNTSTWAAIRECAKFFCEYDEYNYDFSLQNANHNCLQKKLFTLVIRGPRVFHTGACSGVHHQEEGEEPCDADEIVGEIKENLKVAKDLNQLFPKKLRQRMDHLSQDLDRLTPNGGWGDPRDRNLCLNFTLSS